MLPVGLPQDAPGCQELGRPEGLPSGIPRRGPTFPTVATLYKRGGAYYLNWRVDGTQYRRSLGTIDRKAAEAIRAEKEAERHGLITPSRGVTVGDVLDTYMGWYKTERPTTHKRALSALKRFRLAFDNAPAESLSGDAIEKWAAAEAAQGQAEKALKLARAALKRAVAKRRIAHSPMDGVVIPKSITSRAPPYYNREQLRALARQPRGAAWIFMVATGMRRGEMAKARRSDVRDGMILVESLPTGRTKSAKWRAIPLNAHARRALAWLGDDLLVPVVADTLGDWFTEDAEAAGLPGSLHWLRHTFCTILAQQGVSLHEIKRLAGHSSITVTEKYAHHAPDFGRPAVGTMAAWGRGDKHRKKHTRP